MDLQKVLFTILVFHRALLLIKELTAKKSGEMGPHAHGMYWCYHAPHHVEAAGVIEWRNGLLKTQL